MKTLTCLLTAGLVLGGCSSSSGPDLQSNEAVRQGVIEHLSGRAGLDVNSMEIEVTSVDFRGNEADATIAFRAKGSGDPAAGMEMMYTLEQQEDRWVVKESASGSSSSSHDSMMSVPESDAGGMVGGAVGGMPEGHPPVETPESLELQ